MIVSAGKGAQRREPLYTVLGMHIGIVIIKKQHRDKKKKNPLKNRTTIDPSKLSFGYIAKENEISV